MRARMHFPSSYSISGMQQKICLLGTSAVGKTSLISRFVKGIFSESYLTTIGVKIDRKTVPLEQGNVELLLWDLNGEDRFQKLAMSYLRGARGYLLVADGTRKQTLDAALALHHKATATLGQVPFIIVINKNDLRDQWSITDEDIHLMRSRGWPVLETSAKTGVGVDAAFVYLTRAILAQHA